MVLNGRYSGHGLVSDLYGDDLLRKLYMGERPEGKSYSCDVLFVYCDDLIVGFKLAL